MKFATATLSLLAVVMPQLRRGAGFTPVMMSRVGVSNGIMPTRLYSSNGPSEEDMERMRKMMANEAMMNPEAMKQSAEQMKNMTPADMDQMMADMDRMSEDEKSKLKSLGMDVEMMKKSMSLMKNNPELIKNAQRMMERLTPEQMVEQSKMAQEQMRRMTPDQVDMAAKALSSIPADQLDQASQTVVDSLKSEPTITTAPVVEKDTSASNLTLERSAKDPNVLDAMFKVAEYMSKPPTGGVTFKAFATLPPINVLTGNAAEDLSPKELAGCWADGSLGATRVDRAGFERVWVEVQDWFEGDIMDEARSTSHKKQRSPSSSSTTTLSPSTPSSSIPTTPVVGEELSAEQLTQVNDRVKNMSDNEMNDMLTQMQNMTPDQEARMKAMGVDPNMMKKVSGMMKSNPLMKKAAQTMMKNMSPEQMVKASQQAQNQMKNMTPEQMSTTLDSMERGTKKEN